MPPLPREFCKKGLNSLMTKSIYIDIKLNQDPTMTNTPVKFVKIGHFKKEPGQTF